MQPRLLKEPLRLAGPALLALQSDERLVRLVRDGHGPAFTTLVNRYHDALLRFCTRLVGPQRAEDAVQQTFVNAHRALTERDAEVQLRPWLYRIAHNAAMNTLRGETGDPSLDDPGTEAALARHAGASDGLEATVLQREHLQDTLAAISALPAAQRDALVLRELEGRSHVEIAAALGVSAGAARQHLMRARAAVRAAATAVTPYPLLVKVATWMTFTPTGERVTQVAVGAGLGAGVAKVTAGVLATGALVGGVVGTGTVHVPGLHGRPVHLDRAPATAAAATATTPVPPGAGVRSAAASTAAASTSSGRPDGRGGPAATKKPSTGTTTAPARDGREPADDHRGGAKGSGDDHRDDGATRPSGSGSGTSGGDDDGRSGSGSSGSGSGSGGHGSGGSGSGSGHSGSGSGDDRPSGTSGTTGGSGSGTSSGGDDGHSGSGNSGGSGTTTSSGDGGGSADGGSDDTSDGGGPSSGSGSTGGGGGSGSGSGDGSSGGGGSHDDDLEPRSPTPDEDAIAP